MPDRYMVVTDKSVTVDRGENAKGLSEAQASTSAKMRNSRAAEMGLSVVYTIAPFVPAPKEKA